MTTPGTRRARVVEAFQHRETDCVPYRVELTAAAHRRLTEYTGDPHYLQAIGDHIAWIPCTDIHTPVPGRPGYVRDEFGVTWHVSEEHFGVEGQVLHEPSLEGYTFPVPDAAALRRRIEAFLCDGQDVFRMVNVGFTLFEVEVLQRQAVG